MDIQTIPYSCNSICPGSYIDLRHMQTILDPSGEKQPSQKKAGDFGILVITRAYRGRGFLFRWSWEFREWGKRYWIPVAAERMICGKRMQEWGWRGTSLRDAIRP